MVFRVIWELRSTAMSGGDGEGDNILHACCPQGSRCFMQGGTGGHDVIHKQEARG